MIILVRSCTWAIQFGHISLTLLVTIMESQPELQYHSSCILISISSGCIESSDNYQVSICMTISGFSLACTATLSHTISFTLAVVLYYMAILTLGSFLHDFVKYNSIINIYEPLIWHCIIKYFETNVIK